MAKPLIAITSPPPSPPGDPGADLREEIEAGFVAGVTAAGGVPVFLPVVDPDDAPAQLVAAAALVPAGGQDLALDIPEAELAQHPPGERWIDPDRDAHEFALVREAQRRELPTLCVCRGAQLINHLEGGTLFSHIDDHDADDRHAERPHPVELREGTRLASILGSGPLEVNTVHHQAVREPAPGWQVSAIAPDGTIEAIEPQTNGPDGASGESDWIIGVQWHPELMLERRGGQELFDALVEQARSS